MVVKLANRTCSSSVNLFLNAVSVYILWLTLDDCFADDLKWKLFFGTLMLITFIQLTCDFVEDHWNFETYYQEY